jgi:plasmid maintenance system antidote protein VapI
MFLTIEDFKFIREFYDKTHAEMADVCKVSTSHIWRIENDQRSLTQEIARRIVREFRLSP